MVIIANQNEKTNFLCFGLVFYGSSYNFQAFLIFLRAKEVCNEVFIINGRNLTVSVLDNNSYYHNIFSFV